MKIRILCLLLFMVGACTPSRYVKPLPKGHWAVGADLGGPLIGFSDMTIPIPLTNINAGYGLTASTTAFAGIHTTSLLYGLGQLDVGLLHSFSSQQALRPGLSGSVAANMMAGLLHGGFRAYPQLDLNAYWEYGKEKDKMIYLGMSNWFEFAAERAHQEEQPAHWLPSLQLGHTFIREKWDYTIELKQLAFNQDKRNIVVEYKGPGNFGASGLYLSVRRRF